MPFWAVALVVLVLIVGYYLLSQQARERRREKVGGDFAKIPDFYPNQTYTDAGGDTAIGIDDRGRRIAVARRHAQPRTRVYSFAHLISAEVLQNDQVIATVASGASGGPAAVGGQPSGTVVPGGPAEGSLYGSTRSTVRDVFSSTPLVKPILGQLRTAAVRLKFRNGDDVDEVLIRSYDGKPVNVDGVVGERAMAEAQVLLGSLDIAIRRAGSPPRGTAVPRTPVR